MKHRLSISLLAISATLVVGSSAVAAPGVSYKKRLDVPTLPASVITQLKQMEWAYPSATSKHSEGLGMFKNVALLKPRLAAEIECGDTSYRMWTVALDGAITKKLYSDINIDTAATKLSAGTQIATRYVFEARKNNQVKRYVEPTAGAIYSVKNPAPSANVFFGCNGNSAILENTFSSPRVSSYKRTMRAISYANLTDKATWQNLAYDSGEQIVTLFGTEVNSVGGIKQIPGRLTITNGAIYGDSRPITIEPKRGVVQHAMPRYRELSPSTTTGVLQSQFFRLPDGYAVEEIINDGTREIKTYYRIYDGEAQYSVVESLPFDLQYRVSENERGAAIITRRDMAPTIVSSMPLHGYPMEYWSEGSILWETDYQLYTRYPLTNKSTGAQQYWEATVIKN